MTATPYPDRPADRDRWIQAHRKPRGGVDPRQPAAFFLERERAGNGNVVSVATILLTNRECPWRCLMCDLWQHTLPETVPPGAIPAQIDHALEQWATAAAHQAGREVCPGPPPHSARNGNEPVREAEEAAGAVQGLDQNSGWAGASLKLYNSGSFFDPRAIPPEDHPAIAARAAAFERLIVECHPALVGEPVLRFRDLLQKNRTAQGRSIQLEVAMGLETVHPEVLPRLNKRMTLDQFARAAEFLRRNDIALRTFILVQPPFLDEAEALTWANRSVDFAFDCGAVTACLIPTRAGNGALEALAARGDFTPPRLATLETALDYAIRLGHGRVFADTWNLELFSQCPACLPARAARLKEMNLTQQFQPEIQCDRCDHSGVEQSR